MAEHTINSKIKIRKDTNTNWTSKNPTLLDGELGFDSTNNMFKIGNGLATWNELPYVSKAQTLETLNIMLSNDIQYLIWSRNENDGYGYLYKRSDVYIDKDGNLNDIRGKLASLSDIPSIPEIPTKLPNPNAFTFLDKIYDGSQPIEVTLESLISNILSGAVGGGIKIKAMDLLSFTTSAKQSYIQFEHTGQTNENSGLWTIVWGKTNVADTLVNVNVAIPYPCEYYICPVATSNARVTIAAGASSSILQLRSSSSTSYQVTWIAIGR